MTTTTFDEALALAQQLTAADQVRLIAHLAVQVQHALTQEAVPVSRRETLVRAVQGKYAYVPTSSELFAQRKQEDLDPEEGAPS